MFGLWRTALAIEVVAQHLLHIPIIGFYAVFSFFVLSGFLMTAIVHGTYGYSFTGFLRYLSNRALRLLPNYWFALGVSLILIGWLGADTVAHYNLAIARPQSLGSCIENLSMIFWNWLPKDETPRLVPLAWALTVEISYYVLIGLGASRTRMTSFIWLILSFVYVVVIRQIHPEGGGYLYDAIPAGSLPFSVGALAWHFRDTVRVVLRRLWIGDPRLLIVARWMLYGGILGAQALTGWQWLTIFGNWLNIGVSALIVCTLFTARGSPSMRRIDKAVGDFSYPIYLLHLQMGLVAAAVFLGTSDKAGAAVFAIALVLTILLGAVCALGIDPLVEGLRKRIKQRRPNAAAI